MAPKSSGWQRHLPWVALLSALVVGVLAFAQPALALYTPKERATVILTLDTSASMQADDVAPTRLAAAQDAARTFISELPSGLQVGLVTYDYSAALTQPPTTDRSALLRSIDTLELGEGTNTGAGRDRPDGDREHQARRRRQPRTGCGGSDERRPPHCRDRAAGSEELGE